MYLIRACQSDLEEETPKFEKYQFNAMVDCRRIRFLKGLRDRFAMDGDVDYLSRGVTWVNLNYHREIDSPLPEPIVSVSCSAW
jgi:hypothetical protein